MQSLEAIKNQIRELSKANEFLSYREIEELQNVLYDDEAIIYMTTGEVGGYKGLLVATDERIIFIHYNTLNQPKVLEVSYDKLEYVHLKQIDYNVSMEVFFTGTKIEISNIPPDDANSIKEELNYQIEVYQTPIKHNNSSKKKIGFPTFIFLIAIAVATGYFVGPQFKVVDVYDAVIPNSVSKQQAEKTYQLTFIDFDMVKDEYSTKVNGTVTNNSEKEYRYLSVDIQFYDKRGDLVDSEIISALNLKQGKSWHIEVFSSSEYAESYEIVGVYAEEEDQQY
ncbi:PH domain-containing protein [Metabacillus malikii]|uniref:YokE-like PH domain-containing protein n=1 Tax=Metabacillus malikii TaxID=1504265 RepID=A0ABT9ZFE9_9BACI|nr:PH domain-containing protein [Metabacillus malikii]MDQ0230700.1 hypothetical protein [Metabacillus malikii]